MALANLTHAARAAQAIGATVVLEALNSHENPAYPILSLASACHVLDPVRASGVHNVAFLADLYHLGRMGEDLLAQVRRHGVEFGHVQIADTPGRGQPGTGEIDFGEVLTRLVRSGYAGHIGLEYRPVGPSAASFGWLPALRASVEAAA
ncbi:hydroxypyruvate isomerase [Crossiella equi]|uniref:Hydroxypyruvate isomerase n=1 Tax=Crossiella equi TaxID=130796 RepID=A0ABS5AQU2_9PSEU|nr:TIM barrel protein [Crossiella equi]MBP2478767.1 hydroxypyruvate isomerase [Crossiella equi]